jgi:hypothetical protein
MNPTPHRRSSERALFLALWAVLILGTALYRFWPGNGLDSESPPRVVLADELVPWFGSTLLTRAQPSHYTIELALNNGYRESLSGPDRHVQLRFELRGESRSILYQGTTACVLQQNEPKVLIDLPNPNRVSAREISLSLAH